MKEIIERIKQADRERKDAKTEFYRAISQNRSKLERQISDLIGDFALSNKIPSKAISLTSSIHWLDDAEQYGVVVVDIDINPEKL